MKNLLLFIFLLSFYFSNGIEVMLKDNSFEESFFSTTWGTAIVEVENPKLTLLNNTLRQIVHVSASGENIRLKLSNIFGKTNLEIKEINIANSISQGTGEIDTKSITSILFEGENSVIIPPGKEIYSDTISYNLKALSEIAISIYFGEVPENLSGHKASHTFSFIEKGNKIYEQGISKENKINHWYIIEAIEIHSNPRKKTVVCFGDSITDGTGSTNDKHNRWPDLLSIKLHLNEDTSDIAVVNKGIGGNRLTTQGLKRYSNDVLQVKGVSHIIVLYGINDINNLNSTSSDIISAYKKLIKEAHNNNIFIYAGTIVPDGNYKAWNTVREKYRYEVNEWIRNTKPENGGFDYYFDFDKLIRDSKDPTIIYSDYDCGDGLHPSPEGYQRMVQGIDNLELFTMEPNFEKDSEKDPEKDSNQIKLNDAIGIKFKINYVQKGESIIVSIKGSSNGSNGFRILTTNNEGNKTSDYYYTGNIPKGNFENNNIKIKVYDVTDYVVIRRPISTININNIVLESIEVSVKEYHRIFNSTKDGTLL